MIDDAISEIGIDDDGRLYVRPASQTFAMIFRAGKEVGWDEAKRRLHSPMPGLTLTGDKREVCSDLSRTEWFDQILTASADEYGVRLLVNANTRWVNIADDLRQEMASRTSN